MNLLVRTILTLEYRLEKSAFLLVEWHKIVANWRAKKMRVQADVLLTKIHAVEEERLALWNDNRLVFGKNCVERSPGIEDCTRFKMLTAKRAKLIKQLAEATTETQYVRDHVAAAFERNMRGRKEYKSLYESYLDGDLPWAEGLNKAYRAEKGR